MSGCGFFEVGMDGLVETGLGKWKLNSANSAFFSGCTGNLSEPVSLVVSF
jgi:hypothetical protein